MCLSYILSFMYRDIIRGRHRRRKGSEHWHHQLYEQCLQQTAANLTIPISIIETITVEM